jgi:hypothetical protein
MERDRPVSPSRRRGFRCGILEHRWLESEREPLPGQDRFRQTAGAPSRTKGA